MLLRQASPSQDKIGDSLQDRIERLNQEKTRLLDEWSQAMKRAYHVPPPYRHDAVMAVGQRYSGLVDAVEDHVITLKASAGEFPLRMEHLLLRTGRQRVH